MKKPTLVFILVCLVAMAVLGFVFIRNLIDFPVYYAAGRSLLSGRTDLYAPDFALGRVMDYRYPPFFLVALTPCWLLPYSTAAYFWYLISAGEIAVSIFIVARLCPALNESKKMWLLVALATGLYFVMALHYGNAHVLTTFLLFASFYCFIQRRDIGAALLIALTISIKLTPILCLPYFALKRRWKLLTAACVFLIAINLTPAVYFGFKENGQLLETWFRHVVVNQQFHEDNGPINLSLKGQLRRSLSTIDYSQRVDGDVKYPAVNVATISQGQLDTAWAILSAVLLVGALSLIARTTRYRKLVIESKDLIGGSAIELSVLLCLMLLIGPLTSKIYFIALLWPASCLASVAVERGDRVGRFALYALCAVALINVVLPLLPGRSLQRLLLVVGVDFYLNCLLMAALVYLLVVQRVPGERSGAPQMQVQSETRMP